MPDKRYNIIKILFRKDIFDKKYLQKVKCNIDSKRLGVYNRHIMFVAISEWQIVFVR